MEIYEVFKDLSETWRARVAETAGGDTYLLKFDAYPAYDEIVNAANTFFEQMRLAQEEALKEALNPTV